MRFKRRLILIFAILSLVALWDISRSGLGGVVRVLDFSVAPRPEPNEERRPVSERRPDIEEVRELDPISGIRRLDIDGASGKLEIVRSASGEVNAQYTVRIWAGDGSGDLRQAVLSEQVSAVWEVEADRARLALGRPQRLPAGVRALRVDVRVAAPDGVEVAATHAGDALVDGVFGEVRLSHSGGNAVVRGVQGPVHVASSLSKVSIGQVAGPVWAEVQGGDLSVRGVEGSVSGSVQYGELNLDGVTGDLSFAVHQGAAKIENVGGDVEFRGGFGDVEMAQIGGRVGADYSFGALKLRGITREADISMRFGQLEAALHGDGGWTVEAVAEMGEIETDLDLERQDSSQRTLLSGVIGDGAHDLRIKVELGSARLLRH